MKCTCKICGLKSKEQLCLFVEECHKQNMEPQDVNFDFLQNCSRTLFNSINKSTKSKEGPKKADKSTDLKRSLNLFDITEKRKGKEKQQPVRSKTEDVPKIACDEFPNEMFGDINLDPSLEDDYFTIFSPSGNVIVERNKIESQVEDEPEPEKIQTVAVILDRNMKYCMKCIHPGDLMVCDKCPLAFHAKCLNLDKENLLDCISVCPYCDSDSQSHKGGIKDGLSIKSTLLGLYEKFSHEPEFLDKVTVISQLYEIVLALCEAEFGDVFRYPVDTIAVKGYKTIVKRPMDLSTISTKIIQAEYHQEAESFERDSKLDLIILHILRDLEQVWFNCLLFNEPNSNFYRMAQVMRVRCESLKRVNIDSKISDYVKENLELFVKKWEAKIYVVPALERIQKKWFPPSKYQIFNPKNSSLSYKRRPVGIFDPDTNMVVKQYSSFTITVDMYNFLLSKGHESGRNDLTNAVLLRNSIIASPNDPSIKIFGYRWMYMDLIRNGSFKINGELLNRRCNSESQVIESEIEVDAATNKCTSIGDQKEVCGNQSLNVDNDDLNFCLSPPTKRSHDEILLSPNKRERLSRNSLCENVQYSPIVQKKALSAAQHIIATAQTGNVDDKIVIIDVAYIQVVGEYQNLADAASTLNLSKEVLADIVNARRTIDGKLYVFEQDKDQVIERMLSAVNAD